MSELHRVMIYAKPARVVSRGCWSCGKSDTYCDGLYEQQGGQSCCFDCAQAEHDPHTGQ